jgi:hypothetical protein
MKAKFIYQLVAAIVLVGIIFVWRRGDWTRRKEVKMSLNKTVERANFPWAPILIQNTTEQQQQRG